SVGKTSRSFYQPQFQPTFTFKSTSSSQSPLPNRPYSTSTLPSTSTVFKFATPTSENSNRLSSWFSKVSPFKGDKENDGSHFRNGDASSSGNKSRLSSPETRLFSTFQTRNGEHLYRNADRVGSNLQT